MRLCRLLHREERGVPRSRPGREAQRVRIVGVGEGRAPALTHVHPRTDSITAETACSTGSRRQDPTGWSLTIPIACIIAYEVTGPRWRKPRDLRSFASAADSADWLG